MKFIIKILCAISIFSGCAHKYDLNVEGYNVDDLGVFHGKTVYINIKKVPDKAVFEGNMNHTFHYTNIKASTISIISRQLGSSKVTLEKPTSPHFELIPYLRLRYRVSGGNNIIVRSTIKVIDSKNKRMICNVTEEASSNFKLVTSGKRSGENALMNSLRDSMGGCEEGSAAVLMAPSRGQKDSSSGKAATKSIMKKAKKCQRKGGVWVNDSCQIDLD